LGGKCLTYIDTEGIPWAEARLASNNIMATTMMALIPILSELFIASVSLLLYLIPEYTGRKEKASILRVIKQYRLPCDILSPLHESGNLVIQEDIGNELPNET
jgi:hypothetical protein